MITLYTFGQWFSEPTSSVSPKSGAAAVALSELFEIYMKLFNLRNKLLVLEDPKSGWINTLAHVN